MGERERKAPAGLFQTATRFVGAYGFHLLAGLIAACAMLLILGWMTSEVFAGETAAFDESVRQALHRIASPFLTQLFIVVSFVGSPGFLAGVGIATIGVFFYLGWKRAVLLFVITIAGELILDVTLKGFYARIRPEPFFDYALPSSFSFPSGHALGSFCYYGMSAWLVTSRLRSVAAVWSIRVGAGLLILLIGISRVYLGVHFPTDVIAGYITAFIWMITVVLCDRFFEQWG